MVKNYDPGENQDDRLRETLASIAEMASAAINGGEHSEEYGHKKGRKSGEASQERSPGCTIKNLPRRLLVKAAETAKRINPANAPVLGPLAAVVDGFRVDDPMRIAVITSKYWGPQQRTLSVSFLENTPANLRTRIISHLNAWNKTAGISFAATNGTGHVRISRGPDGYWSYLGTDILHIPQNLPTMNLEGFTMQTPESEYKRVVRHEAGHTLGFPHEHMRKALVARIDPEKAYEWFWETYGWDKQTVDEQVLRPLSESSLIGTPPDQTSIMCYQLPGDITRDGNPILGGDDINQTDYGFAAKIYPKPGHVAGAQVAGVQHEYWPETEDVEVVV